MSTHVPGFQSFLSVLSSFYVDQVSHQQHKGYYAEHLSGADPGIYHGGGQVGSGAIIKVMGGSRISGCGGGGGAFNLDG